MKRLTLAFMLAAALATAAPAAAQQPAIPAPRTPARSGAAAVINLNTATASQIATLPGIGPKTADLIVQYRQKNGPFKKIEEIMNVRGIGEKSFLKLKSQLTVEPAK